MSTRLTEIEAAIRVRMSPRLLRWFTSHRSKLRINRNLLCTSDGEEYFYDTDELDDFDAFLRQPWPCPDGKKRPPVPAGIRDELVIESNHKCAFCEYTAHGECAHIDPVARTACNHPHNLIWTCPNHHTEYDHGYNVSTAVTPEHVKLMKKVLQEGQLRHWRIELRACSRLVAFIDQLETISALLNDPKLLDIRPGLESHAAALFNSVSYEAQNPAPDSGAVHGTPINYHGILAKIDEDLPERNKPLVTKIEDVVEEIQAATSEYMQLNSLAMCPLCKGTGTHNRFDCPVCSGDGTVDVEALPSIDLKPFRQVPCPLCKRTGTHNRFDCPICSGEGHVDGAALNEIDLKPFRQVQCPLCKGTGTHNRFDCPICSGARHVDAAALNEIDITPYEQVKCPLCRGRRYASGEECPACHGDGHVDRAFDENFDPDHFEGG